MDKLKNIKNLITNTPLIEIKYRYKNKIRKAFAKCEWYSITGSIKDKVAYQIFKDAYTSGILKPRDKIVEVSSGNMGLSICAIGKLLGHKVTIIMPKSMSIERKSLIRLYGGNLIETDNFLQAFDKCKELEQNGYFCTNQFENISNVRAHSFMTANEILKKKQKLKSARIFVAGIGTSGTLSGIGSKLKKFLKIKVIAIEPTNARIITSPPPYGKHKLQGLSDEILPKLYNQNLVSNVIQISDNDAIAMAQKLCDKLSLGVGISSGANFLGCVLSNNNSITVFPDDNKKYLSTELTKPITTSLVDSIELISVKTL